MLQPQSRERGLQPGSELLTQACECGMTHAHGRASPDVEPQEVQIAALLLELLLLRATRRRKRGRWLFTFLISPSRDYYRTCKYSYVTSCQPQFPVCQPECVSPQRLGVSLLGSGSLETPCLRRPRY